MRTLLILALALAAASALGQTTKPDDPISTTRPSISDSPTIVPVRSFQIESGLTYFSHGGGDPDRSDYGEALLRYGLVPRAELRVVLPNYNLQAGSAPDGFDNTFLGFSYYLGKPFGVDVGIVPGAYFPTGNRDLRFQTVTPAFTLNAQRDLGGGATVGTTLGQTYERHLTQTLATLNYVHPLVGKLTGFVEYAGSFDPVDRPQEYGHVGLQFLATKTQQFDVHGGVGLNAATPHAFVGAGYSVRF